MVAGALRVWVAGKRKKKSRAWKEEMGEKDQNFGLQQKILFCRSTVQVFGGGTEK